MKVFPKGEIFLSPSNRAKTQEIAISGMKFAYIQNDETQKRHAQLGHGEGKNKKEVNYEKTHYFSFVFTPQAWA